MLVSGKVILAATLFSLVVGARAVAKDDVPAQGHAPVDPPAPSASPHPPISLMAGLRLDNHFSDRTFDEPKLSIRVDKPVLIGDADLTDGFNAAVDRIIEDTAGSFESDMLGFPRREDLPPEIADKVSYMTIAYRVFVSEASLLSVAFEVNWYGAGAAHPNSYSRCLSYNLADGTVLALSDFFLPGTAYLQVLSDYSSKALSDRGTLVFPDGALPREANYRNWIITPDGLLVTFDDYQVAPHVVGPQQVLVPYSRIADIVDPDGALGALASRLSISE